MIQSSNGKEKQANAKKLFFQDEQVDWDEL
jgi:hypothetical protein